MGRYTRISDLNGTLRVAQKLYSPKVSSTLFEVECRLMDALEDVEMLVPRPRTKGLLTAVESEELQGALGRALNTARRLREENDALEGVVARRFGA